MCIRDRYKDDQDMLQSFYLGQKIVGTDYDIDTLKEKISKITMEAVSYTHLDVYKRQILVNRNGFE